MNKKHKNKNRQNKPNPVPPQKVKTEAAAEEKFEPIVHKEDNIEQTLQACERVPEIISEVTAVPVSETKEPQLDIPKKPKRNKGKKRNQDKENELFVNEKEQVSNPIVENVDVSDEIKSDRNVGMPKVEVEEANMVPTARKKKNKNKRNIEKPVEDQQQEDKTSTLKEDKNENINIKQQTLPNIEVTEGNSKASKKKNKKKRHRNDSDKSDVTEEVISCTAAFQKLLDANDEIADEVNKEYKEDENTPILSEQSTLEAGTPLNEKLNKIEQPVLQDTEELTENKPEKHETEIIKEESERSKKKNKKHKKHAAKSENIKPVELMVDAVVEEKLSETSANETFIMEKNDKDLIKDENVTRCEELISQIPTMFEDRVSKSEIIESVEKIQSRKPDFELLEKTSDDIKSVSDVPIKDETISMKPNKSEILACTPPDLKPEVTFKIPLQSEKTTEQNKETINVTQKTDSFPPEKGAAEMIKDPSEPIKQVENLSEPKQAAENYVDTKVDEPSKKTNELSEEKTELPSDFSSFVNIQIDVEKTEETEISPPCDAMPDLIEYPRSLSELHLDDNNNMVIQEITVSDEVKLGIPIGTPSSPLIQGSGSTPISSPEWMTFGIQVIELETKTAVPREQERTDLKSKVMEVSQEMEELSMSIEKSLAELTATEKNKQDSEMQFEEKLSTKSEELMDSSTDTAIPDSKNLLQTSTKITDLSKTVEESENRDNETENIMKEEKVLQTEDIPIISKEAPPACPARKDHKGKGKRKGKHAPEQNVAATTRNTNVAESKGSARTDKTEKTEQKTESTQKKSKQQSTTFNEEQDNVESNHEIIPVEVSDFEPIENFEDALTSSVDDVNKTFEMIASEANDPAKSPQINTEESTSKDKEKDKEDQEKAKLVPQPKNLLGVTDIPVPSNKKDYKKEKNKTHNNKQAKVKIKDSVNIETVDKNKKESKESQTDPKRRASIDNAVNESILCMTNDKVEYVYKYSFRKVFLPSACHVCKKDLKQARVPCSYCNLVFYCNQRHRDDDWPQHQALCFAVSTIVHLKDQKFIYSDAKDITGHNYRLLRVQMIVSCEKVLKRKLVPCEQEMLLYPRMCADTACREWRQSRLKDCEGCGQISYCLDHPEHLPTSHQRWCNSYSLYQKLVCYQQTKGRLEPKLPTRVLTDKCQIPEKMNEVLAAIYEEKIDMNDMQYAALTQLATAPLTTVYCNQIWNNNANGLHQKSSFTVHVVGAELQFEADVLNKWELFFLHLRPDIKQLMITLIAPDLNPSNLPLDLLGRIKLCDDCRQSKRRVAFGFQDKKTYNEYCFSDDFTAPDIVCAFNPSIQRSSIYNGKDPWPLTLNCILKLKVPFLITSYTMEELNRDLIRVTECAKYDYKVIAEPKLNRFASVRPDRNFISDDEIPLLFKNYCFAVICGYN